MEEEWVKIRRDALEPYLTCPLCNKLMKEPTANTECIHTFCRKCIYYMITEEEIEWCPICEIEWGIDPLEKMRPDNNLQSLRNKLFPLSERKLKAPEVVPSLLSPARRNEKSLSPGTSNKSAENTEQLGDKIRLFSLSSSYMSLSRCEDSQSTHNKGTKSGAEPQEARWKPLNSLVEAARSKSFKSNVQGRYCDAKLECMKVNDSDSQVQKAKIKDNRCKEKVEDEKIGIDHVSSDTAKANKLCRPRQKNEPAFGESSISPQDVLDATNTKLLRNDSIWFSLVASENQEGEPLPQIPSPYIRIKDGSVPVSFIQKYLKKKLNLESEDEVEIKCLGKSVHPIMQVGNLLESWLDTISAGQRTTVTIGSSAEDFIMVLNYGRKILNA